MRREWRLRPSPGLDSHLTWAPSLLPSSLRCRPWESHTLPVPSRSPGSLVPCPVGHFSLTSVLVAYSPSSCTGAPNHTCLPIFCPTQCTISQSVLTPLPPESAESTAHPDRVPLQRDSDAPLPVGAVSLASSSASCTSVRVFQGRCHHWLCGPILPHSLGFLGHSVYCRKSRIFGVRQCWP